MSVLAGCAGQAASGGTDPATAQMTQGPRNDLRNCRDFTVPVTVGGQQQQAVGQACQQPDGSWRVTQNTPGLPEQVYTLPPQAMSLIRTRTHTHTTGGTPGSMGRSLPAVRFSWRSTFTMSITMTGSTTAAVTEAVTGAVTAGVTAAGGERHRVPQFTAHGACSMLERDAR